MHTRSIHPRPDGVVRTWTIKRAREQDRWWRDEVLEAMGTTLKLDPGGEGEELQIRIAAARPADNAPAPPPDAPPQVRSLYIRRSDITLHGYAPGCKACSAMRFERPPHGAQRRARVQDS